jgi:hypothetical protein
MARKIPKKLSLQSTQCAAPFINYHFNNPPPPELHLACVGRRAMGATIAFHIVSHYHFE